jgi:hypothetical protein
LKLSSQDTAHFIDFIKEYLKSARINLSKFNSGGEISGCIYPCQVNVLWFENPTVEILFFTHLENQPDLTIRIDGPIRSCDAKKILNNALENSSWLIEYVQSLQEDVK